METVQDLLNILEFGVAKAQTAAELYERSGKKVSLGTFKRNLRYLSAEARKLGNRVIGDDHGYYIAMNSNEWDKYKERRFAAIKDELVSFAGADRISVKDLIKLVYAVNVEEKNYELNL